MFIIRTTLKLRSNFYSKNFLNKKRFYSSNQGPFVLIDKNTKVICQGFTGKQVYIHF